MDGAQERGGLTGLVGAATSPAARRGRRARVTWPLMLAGLALVVLSGYRLAAPELSGQPGPTAGRVLPPPAAAPASTPSGGPASASSPAASAAPMVAPPVVSDPARLRIPAIAVDAPVVGLGLTPQGAIDVPTGWGDVGWYQPGVAPGAVGPAVLVGHYDSKKGPAVFYRLRSLLAGDQMTVVGASGVSVTFVVDRTQTVSKAAFPTQEVYGPVTRPEIRLITCDGGFDEHTHHYLDNLVVYGHAIATPAATPVAASTAVPAAGAAGAPAAVPSAPPASGAAPTGTATATTVPQVTVPQVTVPANSTPSAPLAPARSPATG